MRRNLSLLLAFLTALCPLSAQISKAPLPYLTYTYSATHADAVFEVGEAGCLRVTASAGGAGLDGVSLSFSAGNDRQAVDTIGTAVFHDGVAVFSVGTMKEPGFRYAKFRFEVAGESYNGNLKLAFSPWNILPSVGEPADFDDFWCKTLKKAAKVPMEYELTPVPEYSDGEVETFAVRLQSYEKGNYIYGYLSQPRDGQKHPVLFNPPGAGVKRIPPSPDYAREGYIVFSIGVNGIPMNPSDSLLAAFRSKLGDYQFSGVESRDEYYYKRIYASCVRCIDFLVSLPQFDGKNVGVTGGSQGGALSMVTAGLDPRVTFLAAFYPAMCDMSGYTAGRAGGWPGFYRDGDFRSDLPQEQVLETLSYYDVANFAKRIQCPGFYSFGFNDDTCPPTSVCAAVNRVQAPKVVVNTPISGHWRFPETHRQGLDWMQSQWKK